MIEFYLDDPVAALRQAKASAYRPRWFGLAEGFRLRAGVRDFHMPGLGGANRRPSRGTSSAASCWWP